ncbi:hypothetical protein D3C86_1454920 [compost metagenome]
MFAGCKKKGGGSKSDTYYFRGRADGALMASTSGITGSLRTSPVSQLTLFGRYGAETNFGGFDLSLIPFNGPGTYPLGRMEQSLGLFRLDKQPLANYVYSSATEGSSGSVIVTSFSNNVVRGKFEFTAKNNLGESKTVTEGEFEVKVENQ